MTPREPQFLRPIGGDFAGQPGHGRGRRGLFGAPFPVITADLTRGTGHFNTSLGAIATAKGIGASLSNAAAGFIAVQAGYGGAFLALAAVAAVGGLLFWRAAEQARIVRALVEQVVVGPAGADIRLRVEGLAGLVRDLTAIAPEALRAAA